MVRLEDLEPCPFCDSRAMLQIIGHSIVIFCAPNDGTPPCPSAPGVMIKFGTDNFEEIEAAAAKAWNTRAYTGRMKELETRNAELQKVLRDVLARCHTAGVKINGVFEMVSKALWDEHYHEEKKNEQ